MIPASPGATENSGWLVWVGKYDATNAPPALPAPSAAGFAQATSRLGSTPMLLAPFVGGKPAANEC